MKLSPPGPLLSSAPARKGSLHTGYNILMGGRRLIKHSMCFLHGSPFFEILPVTKMKLQILALKYTSKKFNFNVHAKVNKYTPPCFIVRVRNLEFEIFVIFKNKKISGFVQTGLAKILPCNYD